MAGTTETNFDKTLQSLTHIYGVDRKAVQKSKEGVLYKFTEIITHIINHIFGSNSVEKAENILRGRVFAIETLPDEEYPLEAALISKIDEMKTKYPNLIKMLDRERSQIRTSLEALQRQFSDEKEKLALAQMGNKTSEALQYASNIEDMAHKFLEFEEGLKLLNLKTDAILLPGLKMQLEEKFEQLNKAPLFLNNKLKMNIQNTNDIKDLNDALLILNQIENYTNTLGSHFSKQEEQLKALGISQSVRDSIRKQQTTGWEKFILSIEHPSQLSEVNRMFEDLEQIWNDEALLKIAYYHTEKEYSEKSSRIVRGIKNNALKAVVNDATVKLLQEADANVDDSAKIKILGSLNEVVVKSVQNFLSKEVTALQPALDDYGQGLVKLGLTENKALSLKNEIRSYLSKEVKYLSEANHLLEDINTIKKEKTFDYCLSVDTQKWLDDQRKDLEVIGKCKDIEAKWPKQARMQRIATFLGDRAKGSIFADLVSSLAILSDSKATREEKEKAIVKINTIKEEELVNELRIQIDLKSEELFQLKQSDLEKMMSDHQDNLLNYPWLAKEEETRPIVMKCVNLIDSVSQPELGELNQQRTLLSLLNYTENQLITPEKNMKSRYRAKKNEAITTYGDWLQAKITAKLNAVLSRSYHELTKNTAKKEEKFAIYNNFVKEKAKLMKSHMHGKRVVEYLDLDKLANRLMVELKEKLTPDSIFTKLESWFS